MQGEETLFFPLLYIIFMRFQISTLRNNLAPTTICFHAEAREEVITARVEREFSESPRSLSTDQLHMSPRFHLPPINPVVCRGPYHFRVEVLILGRASRLDAFSVYRSWT